MKTDRLVRILAILLQQEKTTAQYLAEEFQVSRRTINRDVAELCRAGIPLETSQGPNGGVSFLESGGLNQILTDSPEIQEILEGLHSLDSAQGTDCCGMLMKKRTAEASGSEEGAAHI